MYLPEIELWLDQFNKDPADRPLAELLLSKVNYMNHTDVRVALRKRITRVCKNSPSSAIYVERELQRTRHKKGLPPPMYREEKVPSQKPRRRVALRVVGAAKPAVQSLKNKRQVIGSEGVLAQALSSLCVQHARKLMFHPSADEIRDNGVRKLIIVTDFIGSGDRIKRMLSSFWRVRSIRSWRSYGLAELVVVAVSGSKPGIDAVKRHPSKPTVLTCYPCPTIFDSFDPSESDQILTLCADYGSFSGDPLGYGEVGALMAFEHSAPNNMPAIFTEQNISNVRPWSPLFINRSTEAFWLNPPYDEKSVDLKFETLGLPTIHQSMTYRQFNNAQRAAVLITAAVSKGRRSHIELIAVTDFPVKVLFQSMEMAEELGLINHRTRLTQKGRALLDSLSPPRSETPLVYGSKTHYYPTQLRAPI